MLEATCLCRVWDVNEKLAMDFIPAPGHTRASLMLVNLVYGSAENPILVTNTGSAPSPTPRANEFAFVGTD